MNTLALELQPCARNVRCTDEALIVELLDGRNLSVPLTQFPRLSHASREQRNKWELLGDGEGIHWSEIDEDLSIAGLLAKRKDESTPKSAFDGRAVPKTTA